ncbi:hypothetical protein HXX76_000616 [Chlamydomonas incerta]|uniref:Uncharacterized protein n=1 Tax=Chlamydomonas incerta TaxID=51695 RepID=A0A835WER5_CHLIN|nr:hypothetical protein HXX76_000616 [Chlamydomonas incerta]|eukprot:KAG2446013.1 hypothetical protein HXX76_000616 [Chlamydomonas incerta]
MFAASRSLNRSIGVRRRTSDAEGSTVSEHAAKREAEEERELAGPDPLREQFEREKDNNPLLPCARPHPPAQRRPTAMSARNSEKSMKSIKSKSSKRPSVGFALGEDDDEDVDPDAHLEAERIASITMPDEEPARAVRMAAAGLGLGPAPGPEQRRSSGGGGRGGLRQGSR